MFRILLVLPFWNVHRIKNPPAAHTATEGFVCYRGKLLGDYLMPNFLAIATGIAFLCKMMFIVRPATYFSLTYQMPL